MDKSNRFPREIVSTIFFLSGMTGLSYEVIWFKQFSHVWGSSTTATATVVAAFLLGIGIGAVLGGYIADQTRKHVFWYGVFEIAIGILALVIPWETDLLWQFSAQYYAYLREMPIWYAFVRCATTFVLIGPPCILMGATLPILVRQFSTQNSLGDAIGWLYGVNTLGAAFGCYFVGFHLLPFFGLFQSNLITAVLNMSVGAIAIVLSKNLSHEAHAAAEAQTIDYPLMNHSGDSTDAWPLYLTIISAIVSGEAALILQTVWTRKMALVLGSSTFAFSAMLFVFLGSIGIGSIIYKAVLSTYSNKATMILATCCGIVISSIIGIRLLPLTAQTVGALIPLRTEGTANAFICILGSFPLQFIPGIGMGVLFPLLISTACSTSGTLGRTVGSIYAWNTIGSILGCAMTAIWIVPENGSHVAIFIALALYLSIPVLILLNAATINGTSAVVLSITTVAIALFWNSPEDPRSLNMGMFLYGYGRPEEAPDEILYFKEGLSSNVFVTRKDGATVFRVNGKVDGSSRGDMRTQLGLAYFPLFLNPDAKDVLVVGFGTGTSSGACLLFPNTNVTCCELEPAIVSASKYFSQVNHEPQESDRFRAVFDDARSYIQGTDRKFDLILSAPSNPWIAGVSNLFTNQFYQQASLKLAPNGIFAQWIQTYSFTPTDYAMVVRTMSDTFKYRRLVRIDGADTVLLGSNEPFDRSKDILEASVRIVGESDKIRSDLEQYFDYSDVRSLLLSHVVLDEAGLKRLVDSDGTKNRNSDENLQLEFRAAQNLYGGSVNNTNTSILKACSSKWCIDHFESLHCGKDEFGALWGLARLLNDSGRSEEALQIIDFGLSKDSDSSTFLVAKFASSGPLDEEVKNSMLDKLFGSSQDSLAEDASQLGVMYWQQRKYSDAVAVFERLAAKFPNSVGTAVNLAVNYDLLGKHELAKEAIELAKTLDSTDLRVLTEFKRIMKADSLRKK